MNVNDFELEGGSLEDLLGTSDIDTNPDNQNDEPVNQNDDDSADFNYENDADHSNFEGGNNDDVITSDSEVLITFLKEYGINDGKITYENDNGDTEEVNFSELDSAEQLNILKELTSHNLSESEIETINFLRKYNVSFQDAVEYYSKKAVEDYINNNGPAQREYSIDEYSDEELYFADLKAKYPEMTDDEIKSDVELAKENEELFKKKAEAIRKQYKAREDEKVQNEQRERENEYNQFTELVKSSITQFNAVSLDYKDKEADYMVVDNNMKNEMYQYLMKLDENGKSQFAKDLEDTNKWAKFAWFALYGDEAISDITNYWKNELKTTRREVQKSKSTQTQTQTTVIKPDNKRKEITDYHRNSVDFVGGENLL